MQQRPHFLAVGEENSQLVKQKKKITYRSSTVHTDGMEGRRERRDRKHGLEPDREAKFGPASGQQHPSTFDLISLLI